MILNTYYGPDRLASFFCGDVAEKACQVPYERAGRLGAAATSGQA
jgi:hypothetical protein